MGWCRQMCYSVTKPAGLLYGVFTNVLCRIVRIGEMIIAYGVTCSMCLLGVLFQIFIYVSITKRRPDKYFLDFFCSNFPKIHIPIMYRYIYDHCQIFIELNKIGTFMPI